MKLPSKKYYKGFLFFMIFFIYFLGFSQKDSFLKEISGVITYRNTPLSDVNIIIKNKNRGTKTDAQGFYKIKANIGDIIQYSYIGFKTVTIVIEDITNILTFEMIIETNLLEEALVKTKRKSIVLERAEKGSKKFKTAVGMFDPKASGYKVGYLDGEEISPIYSTLSQALAGKFSGGPSGGFMRGLGMSINNPTRILWDVDGALYTEEPPVDLNLIKDIHILSSIGATIRYGHAGAGGVIIVRTKYGSFDDIEKKKKKIVQQYQNKQTYANDALEVNAELLSSNTYTLAIEAFHNKQQAHAYYQETVKKQLKDYATQIGIAQKFTTYYIDRALTIQILKDLSKTYIKNPEIQKAIAYQFQALSAKKEAIAIYQHVFKLRPNYAQSYRDLANAYRENDQYKKAWRMYMTYLLKGHDVSGEGIGQLLYNEMEWLYFNRKNQSQIKERFVPKSENIKDFRNDVRLVFEWNTSEAEFDLEFVNPQLQVYTFEHSLAKNQNLITDEKKKGYSSKEFIIENLNEGQWLINITYQGNKKPEPTYLKVTQYYNWGKPNQKEKITIYQFKDEREKIQLFRLNKQVLIVTN